MIHVVICNYNAASHLKSALDSVQENKTSDVRLLVVDNASRDGSVPILERYASDGVIDVLVKNTVNEGKAAAVNKLVRTADPAIDDLVLSLDSDLTLMSKDFFDKAAEYWRILEGKVSCVVCQQLGNNLCKRPTRWREGKGFSYFSDQYGEAIAGGAMFIPFRHWRTAGGYDETRGLYGGNDGQLMLVLGSRTKLPMCVVRELMVFHPYEEDIRYQLWKNEAHRQQVYKKKCLFEKGFYDSP